MRFKCSKCSRKLDEIYISRSLKRKIFYILITTETVIGIELMNKHIACLNCIGTVVGYTKRTLCEFSSDIRGYLREDAFVKFMKIMHSHH